MFATVCVNEKELYQVTIVIEIYVFDSRKKKEEKVYVTRVLLSRTTFWFGRVLFFRFTQS